MIWDLKEEGKTNLVCIIIIKKVSVDVSVGNYGDMLIGWRFFGYSGEDMVREYVL